MVDGLGVDVQYTEDRKTNRCNVVFGAATDEVLVESGEGEFSCAGCEKGQGGGDLGEDVAEEPVLFAFLADDGCNTTDEAVVTIWELLVLLYEKEGLWQRTNSKECLDILKSTKYDVGECRCKCNCIL